MLITDTHVYYYGKDDWPSNFHPVSFPIKVLNSTGYFMARTGEHAFQMCKAALFNDMVALERILTASSPFEALQLGRTIKGYSDPVWLERRESAMRHVLRAKINSSTHLKRQALEFKGKCFVEASPRNQVWGVGLSVGNPDITDPTKWRGTNLQGKSWNTVINELTRQG